MSEPLLVPQVPESKPEDPEDVSWALSTAEAMWARGEHADGIKWVRRAAEAASEAEDDARALELAKAAADLAGMIARRSVRESIDLEEVTIAGPPPAPPVRSTTPPKPAAAKPGPSNAPTAPKPGGTAVSPSRAPAPLPSGVSAAPLAKRPAQAPALEARPAAAKPAATTTTTAKPATTTPGRPAQAAPGKKSRRSRENLDAEARAALGASSTARLAALDSSTDLHETAETVAIQVPHRRRSRPEQAGGESGSPTTGSMPVAKPAEPTTAGEPHDPAIVTSQAVRVVVWRDASGVHVATAGTRVSAITVDALLVGLEPSADLTAWLSERDSERRR